MAKFGKTTLSNYIIQSCSQQPSDVWKTYNQPTTTASGKKSHWKFTIQISRSMGDPQDPWNKWSDGRIPFFRPYFFLWGIYGHEKSLKTSEN